MICIFAHQACIHIGHTRYGCKTQRFHPLDLRSTCSACLLCSRLCCQTGLHKHIVHFYSRWHFFSHKTSFFHYYALLACVQAHQRWTLLWMTWSWMTMLYTSTQYPIHLRTLSLLIVTMSTTSPFEIWILGCFTFENWKSPGEVSYKAIFIKNMHSIELGVPFRIGLRSRRSTHFIWSAYMQY